MTRAVLVGTGISLAMAAVPGFGQNQPAQSGAVEQLVQRFVDAERAYDGAALAAMISPEYVEVSPLGDVDEHDRFLSFYTPDKKTDVPRLTLSDPLVRVFGDTAIEVVTFHYQLAGPDGATRPMVMRGSFVAQREGGAWKLLGAHYTGVRKP